MSTGPRVVAIGGGHGVAATLRAVKGWASTVTAIVSVADDGGSSGRLRRDLEIMATGDMRRCLQVLAPDGLLNDAVGHRFESGELEGHPPGNLLLAGLLQRADDPVQAVDTMAAAMGVRGRVLPAASVPVDLVATTAAGRVEGQVAIGASRGIRELGWIPSRPPVPAEALAAIDEAELIVLGPGSLFTSVLAAVLPDIREAIADSSAHCAYVANLVPQAVETEAFSLSDHVAAVLNHGVRIDIVIADDAASSESEAHGVEVVRSGLRAGSSDRHDVGRLASALRDFAAVTVSGNQSQSPHTGAPSR